MKSLLNYLVASFIVIVLPKFSETSDEVPPCPLLGGHRRHVNYRRQEPKIENCDFQNPGPICKKMMEEYTGTLPPGYTMPTEAECPGGATCTDSVLKEISKERRTTTAVKLTRTTPWRISFLEDCDYLAYYCMKAYQTGQLCGKAYYLVYHSFPNYCLLDYVNCMEKFEVWQVIHMGRCEPLRPLQNYKHYAYNHDYFLDQYDVTPVR